jgi:hypothetical protein
VAKRPFPGGPYVLLHTPRTCWSSHCHGADTRRAPSGERIYADTQAERFGILLYTGSPDAEGTLAAVQEARHTKIISAGTANERCLTI